ncbi:MAG: rRNA maturation RNase YbeY [Clostridiaceae bacterium]|nr:rRNA maturation RNase YbeY [Clostridiaceae bacterium]
MIELTIENLQNEVEFTKDLENIIEKAVSYTLSNLGCDIDCEIGVTIVNNEEIRKLNKEYRGKDSATDVLSFPMIEFDADGVMIEESAEYNGNLLVLGDIVISLPRAKEQAEEYGHSLLREVGFLTVHSMLHLFGFDHEGEQDEKIMRQKEKEILESMNLPRE